MSVTPRPNEGKNFPNTVCQYVILILTTLSNSLLILSLLTRKSALSVVDKLMLHTVIYNLLLVWIGIPTSLKIDDSPGFPYGVIGCKLINPLCTFFINVCVFTYVVIAFERWTPSRKLHYMMNQQRLRNVLIFTVINVSGLLVVFPYMYESNLQVLGNVVVECGETWDSDTRKIYTVILFLVQYAFPVPIMIFLYIFTWRRFSRATGNIRCSFIEPDPEVGTITASPSLMSPIEIPLCISPIETPLSMSPTVTDNTVQSFSGYRKLCHVNQCSPKK